MITTDMKWRTAEEARPDTETPVLVCSRHCEIDEALCDEDGDWYTSNGFPLLFDVWMWAEVCCPDGHNPP